jgi:hypothetical protein
MLLPHLGAYPEADTGWHLWWQAEGQRVAMVESQGEIAQPRPEGKGVGIGGQVAAQGHSLSINETEILDKGRAEPVRIQTGLEGRQPLREFHKKTVFFRPLEDQQP